MTRFALAFILSAVVASGVQAAGSTGFSRGDISRATSAGGITTSDGFASEGGLGTTR
ncbi:hypothetical protein [Nioella nitratireducens]|uniref:hypothetical protein n=1 Tax=Nioella nitratireducens TaxID=1287720 RepID=UPI00131502EA|nr:hypothetical protein [Nioella nitratireducens]